MPIQQYNFHVGPTDTAYSAEWSAHDEIRNDNRKYFSGEFALELGETPEDQTDPPELYPLGINIVKWLCHQRGNILIGEFDPSDPAGPIPIAFDQDKSPTENREQKASVGRKSAVEKAWEEIVTGTPIGPMIHRGAVEQGPDGGFFIQIKKQPSGAPWLVYRPDAIVKPKWHPDNPDYLVSCTLSMQCAYEDVEAMLGFKVEKQYGLGATYEEKWTKDTVEIFVDGNRVNDASGKNPFGFVPFEYFPAGRTQHEFYGDLFVSDVIDLMLEMNITLRDIGDNVRLHAHPTMYSVGVQDTNKLSRKSGVINHLGGAGPGGTEPKLAIVEGMGVNESAFKYLAELWRIIRYLAFITPVDVGEDEGSQRSGLTLEVRKQSAIHAARRIRSFWDPAMRRLVRKALIVYSQSKVQNEIIVPELRLIRPMWADFLPTDMSDVATQISTLMGVDAMSLEEAVRLRKIKNPDEEVARIKAAREEKRQAEMESQKQQAEVQAANRPQPTMTQRQRQTKASNVRKEKA